MIVDNGKLNAEQLLAASASGKPFTHIAFGTNGTPVSSADTAITSPLIKAITSFTYGPNNTLILETDILTTDPAMVIAEVGLLNADGVLCHRKVYDPPKNKVAGIGYHQTYIVKVV